MTVLKQFALSREKAEMSIFSETTCKRKGQLEVPARAILLSLFCTIKEFPTKYLYALHCVPLRGTTIQMCDNGNYSGTFLAPPAANTIQIRVTLSSNRRILAPPYERGFFLFKWYWPPAAALEKEGDFARTPRAPAGDGVPLHPPSEQQGRACSRRRLWKKKGILRGHLALRQGAVSPCTPF